MRIGLFGLFFLTFATLGAPAFGAPEDVACQPNGEPLGHMQADGWYAYGPPKGLMGPALFPSEAVAAGSAGCAQAPGRLKGTLKPSQDRCAAQGGYRNVHLYLALDNGDSGDMAAAVAYYDPWWHDPKYKDRVYLVRSNSRLEVQNRLVDLLRDCDVVSYAYVSSHGNSDTLGWGDWGAEATDTLDTFTRDILSPCLLAPGAHVQFDGCNIGCGTGAETTRHALDAVFSAYSNQLEGVKVFLNTSKGVNEVAIRFADVVNFVPKSYSRNGKGLVLTRANGAFVANIPKDRVPACLPDR